MALKTLSNIPRGLPGSLSGRSMDELAEELVFAQFAETADGDTIVKLGKKWYVNDRLALQPVGELLAARLHPSRPSVYWA